jgi:hypothetical protein
VFSLNASWSVTEDAPALGLIPRAPSSVSVCLWSELALRRDRDHWSDENSPFPQVCGIWDAGLHELGLEVLVAVMILDSLPEVTDRLKDLQN